LIGACFAWALQRGSALALRLWPLVIPFQRQRFGGGTRFLDNGLDYALADLNRLESDDCLSVELLRLLLLDCRSNFELFHVALAGLTFDGSRLLRVAKALANASRAEDRARGLAVLGWLGGETALLTQASENDRSLWVRRVAIWSLENGRRELWSRHWFDKFATATAPEGRWAAGTLFLKSSDARSLVWARRRALELPAGSRLRGEAQLLLWAAHGKADRAADEMRRHFLGTDVSSLEGVAHPWARDDHWAFRHY